MNSKFKTSDITVLMCGRVVRVWGDDAKGWQFAIYAKDDPSETIPMCSSSGYIWRYLAYSAAMDTLEHSNIFSDTD